MAETSCTSHITGTQTCQKFFLQSCQLFLDKLFCPCNKRVMHNIALVDRIMTHTPPGELTRGEIISAVACTDNGRVILRGKTVTCIIDRDAVEFVLGHVDPELPRVSFLKETK